MSISCCTRTNRGSQYDREFREPAPRIRVGMIVYACMSEMQMTTYSVLVFKWAECSTECRCGYLMRIGAADARAVYGCAGTWTGDNALQD